MSIHNNKSAFGMKGKGGGGNESPDNLRSNSIAKLIDVISEGPIKGIKNGLQGVYLDRTPVANENGTQNFTGLQVTERLGLPDQPFIKGFVQAETTVAVDTQVTQDIPVVRQITDTLVDGVRVIISTPGLSKANDDGDLKGSEFTVRIDVQPDGGSYYTAHTMTVKGKKTSSYERAVRIDLPEATGPWQLRVTRVSEDSDSVKKNNDSYFASYTLLQDAKLSYPDTAYAATRVDAREFGSQIAARRFHVEGLETPVPSNYDPETRTYTGFWDGTFVNAYHNNPAWVFYALLTNDRWGLGDLIPEESVDKFALYNIARYCDELVPDANGDMEPRFTFNGVLKDRVDAAKALDSIAGTFRGMIYWGAGNITVSQDSPRSPSTLVTPANVIDGEFNYSGTPLSARSTSVAVTWNDPRLLGDPTVLIVQRDDLIQKFGERRKEVQAVGCTSRSQARRYAEWVLYTEEFETELVSYRAAMDHATLRPGEVIAIADPSYAGARYGGRLRAVQIQGDDTTVVLDSEVNILDVANASIYLTLENGAVLQSDINSTFVTADGFTACRVPSIEEGLEPISGAMFVIAEPQLEPRQFRVLSVLESEKNIFQITALFHDPQKFGVVDLGEVYEESVYTLEDTGALAPPIGLNVKNYHAPRSGTSAERRFILGWSAPIDSRVIGYKVYITEPGLPSRFVAEVEDTFIDIPSQTGIDGFYTFRVRSVGTEKQMSIPVDIAIDLANTLTKPLAPTGWDGLAGNDSITLSGNPYYHPSFRTFGIYANTGSEQTFVKIDECNSPTYVRVIKETLPAWHRFAVSAILHGGEESDLTTPIEVFPVFPGFAGLDPEVFELAEAAGDRANEANITADSVRADHDALVENFLDSSLVDAFGARDTAINDANTLAQSAQDDVDAALVSVGEARDAAATAQENADTALLETRLTSVAARRGTGLLADEFFIEGTYAVARAGAQGVILKEPNAFYPEGQSITLTVDQAEEDGLVLSSSDDGIVGDMNADLFAVTLEYTLRSGTLEGAGIRIALRADSASEDFILSPFSDWIESTPPLNRTQIVTLFLPRPESASEQTTSGSIQLIVNDDALGTLTAKSIQFHRVSVRAAAPEEIGRGLVQSAIEEYAVTYAELDSAIASVGSVLSAEIATTESEIRSTLQSDYLTSVDIDNALSALRTTLTAEYEDADSDALAIISETYITQSDADSAIATLGVDLRAEYETLGEDITAAYEEYAVTSTDIDNAISTLSLALTANFTDADDTLSSEIAVNYVAQADFQEALASLEFDLVANSSNYGFESGTQATLGVLPSGWKFSSANSDARLAMRFSLDNAPDSLGLRSYGCLDFNDGNGPGPWWYVSKSFAVVPGQLLNVDAMAKVNTSAPSGAVDVTFMGEDDAYIQIVQYDAIGDVLITNNSQSAGYRGFTINGTYPTGWTSIRIINTEIVDGCVRCEVRIVAADGNDETGNNRNTFADFSGNAVVLLDDVAITSPNGVLLEDSSTVSLNALAYKGLDSALATVSQTLTTRIDDTDGEISDIKGLEVDGSTAFGTLLTQLDVNAGGTSAYLSSIGSAVADIEGNASINYVLRGATNGAAAELEIFAQDDANGASSSGIRMRGDNIIALGTLSTDTLVAGMRRNLLYNADLNVLGLEGYSLVANGTAGNQTTLSIQSAPGVRTNNVDDTISVFQSGNATGNDALLYLYDKKEDSSLEFYSAAGGEVYEFSAYISAIRCSCRTRLSFEDANGNVIGVFNSSITNESGPVNSPLEWNRPHVIATAPVGTAVVRPIIVKAPSDGTGANSVMYVFRPMLAETHGNATQPTPYSPPGTTLIEGGRMITRSIKADSIEANSISAVELRSNTITAASGIIANLAVDTLQIADAAISAPQTAFNVDPPDLTLANSWQTMLTTTYQRQLGYHTHLLFSVDMSSFFLDNKAGYARVQIQIMRDGSLIETTFFDLRYTEIGANDATYYGALNISKVDRTTSGGVAVYSVRARIPTISDSDVVVTTNNASIILSSPKK